MRSRIPKSYLEAIGSVAGSAATVFVIACLENGQVGYLISGGIAFVVFVGVGVVVWRRETQYEKLEKFIEKL